LKIFRLNTWLLRVNAILILFQTRLRHLLRHRRRCRVGTIKAADC
jgi:hypothetical protein